MQSQHLCLLHVATAGKQGPQLGADEKEIVVLNYALINAQFNTVLGMEQYVVKPLSFCNGRESLSEEILQNSSLTNELVNHGVSLCTALEQFDQYITQNENGKDGEIRNNLCLVTVGQEPLRQCLHPEVESKNIHIAGYYSRFHDIRKEFQQFYGVEHEPQTIREITEIFGMRLNLDSTFFMTDILYMLNIVQRMIADGHRFEWADKIEFPIQPQSYLADADYGENCLIKAMGFSYFHSETRIMKFFRGLTIENGGIALGLDSSGQMNGIAYIAFVDQKHRDMALKRNWHHLGERVISVEITTKEEFIEAARKVNSEAKVFLAKRAQVILGMKGLPYDCSVQQVISFFPYLVMDGPEGILFLKKGDGTATGYAFVLYMYKEHAQKVLLNNRQFIGSRMVELFFATREIVMTFLSRANSLHGHQELPIADLKLTPFLDNNDDCVRLLGLPFIIEARNVLQFLGDYAKDVALNGVHIVYQPSGLPRGDAFIRMNSVTSAFLAAQEMHCKLMTIGNMQWIIQVYQCSKDDMRRTLTPGNLTTPVAPPNFSAMLFPHMMCMPPNFEASRTFVQSDAAELAQLCPIAMSPANIYAEPLPDGTILPPSFGPVTTFAQEIPNGTLTQSLPVLAAPQLAMGHSPCSI